MYCNKCGSIVPEGSTFCQNCGTSVNQTNSLRSRTLSAVGSIVHSNSIARTQEQEIKQLAERSFLYGLFTIPLFAVAVGAIAMILALYCGFKSNRLAKEARLPYEKKAKLGTFFAFSPFMIAAIVGIVYAMIAIFSH